MIRKDYIPKDDDALAQWALVLQTQANLGVNANAMGWGSSGSEVAGAASEIAAGVAAKEAARQACTAEVAARDAAIDAAIAFIRPMVAEGKKKPTATEAIQKALGVWGAEVPFDPATYKAELRSAVALGNGALQIKFSKALGELDVVNLCMRKTGEMTWKTVATMVRSPFTHHVALTTPGVPESYEARVCGLVGNVEVGLPSDAVTVLVN